MDTSIQIKEFAKSLGFNIVRIIPAVSLKEHEKHMKEWLKQGHASNLEYMKKNIKKRFDPEKILPGVKSIICLAMNYYQDFPDSQDQNKNAGKVARYAWGKDYHIVIEKKLKKLRNFIIENVTRTENLKKNDFKLYTDAGPFLERGYAAHAGLGFIGKNTMLITKEYGSWVFLAEVLTKLELPENIYDITYSKDGIVNEQEGMKCGDCRRCIDACPVKAIVKPYEIDARKCISYNTIENKDDIPGEIKEKLNNRVFGCDICQEVCPHNCRAKKTKIPEFLKHRSGPYLLKSKLEMLCKEEFSDKFKGSPIKRAGLKKLIGNMKDMV